MLFGGSSTSSKPRREEKKERKDQREEKFEVQEAVFTRWANAVLDETSSSFNIQELRDFSDIKFLSPFCQLITGTAPSLTGSQSEDVEAIFQTLISTTGFEDDKLLQLNIPDYCDGVQKVVLAACWQLIQIYWRRFAPAKVREKKVTEALKDWCLEATGASNEVRVVDFTSSWRDGIAMNVLLQYHNSSLVDMAQIRELRGDERLDNAFNLARKHYKAPRLIHTREFHSEHLDTKSAACYLMMLYLSIHSSRPQQPGAKTSVAVALPRHSKQISSGGTSVQSAQGTPPFSATELQRQDTPTSPTMRKSGTSMGSPTASLHQQQLQQQHQRKQTPPNAGAQQYSPKGTNAPGVPAAISPLAAAAGASASAALAAVHQQQLQQLQQIELQQQQQQHIQQQMEIAQAQQQLELQQQQLIAQQQLQLQLQLEQQRQEQERQQQLQQAQQQPLSPTIPDPQRAVPDETVPLSPIQKGAAYPDAFLNESALTTETPSSRKSSSSSQGRSRRSSKSRKLQEDVIRDYESCLEQVLTWLLEAEHELQCMDGEDVRTSGDDLPTVKKKFREYEQFMKSLTESQDSVGRVLHRGQMLSQRLGSDSEQAVGILSQLHMVNERWERIRKAAMQRQRTLQLELNRLQRQHLESISQWLTQFEAIIASDQLQRLADEPDACRLQIAEHAQIQEQIELQQTSVRRLSTFIAVVDPVADTGTAAVGGDESDDMSVLESLLQSTSQRWANICEWAEQRSRHLDGLAELLEHYKRAFLHLSNWLAERQNDLKDLREVSDLISEEDVREQMRALRRMETALEQEHAAFVELSRFCSELVQRYEQGKNPHMANQIRGQLDAITETWDQIVTQLEHNSQALMSSEKAKLARRKRGSSSSVTRRGSTDGSQLSSASSSSRLKKVQDAPESAPAPAAIATSSSSDAEQTSVAVEVSEFVERVEAMEREIRPLFDWSVTFQMSTRREDVRQMVQICQHWLKEIKEMEPRVTKLQIALERVHARNRDDITLVDAQHLHVANEVFERFMQKWSRIVARISDVLNVLSNPPSVTEKNDADMILVHMTAWLKSANKALTNIADEAATSQSDSSDQTATRIHRRRAAIDAISEQLNEHQRHVGFLKRRFEDDVNTASGSSDAEAPFRRQQALRQVECDLIELVRRVEALRRGDTIQQSPVVDMKETTPKLSTTVVQMKKTLHSSDEEGETIPAADPLSTVAADNFSPEPQAHEADALKCRLKIEQEGTVSTIVSADQPLPPTPRTRASELDSWIAEREPQLRAGGAAPGDVKALKEELQQWDILLAEVRERLYHEVQLQSKDEGFGFGAPTVSAAATDALDRFARSAETRRSAVVDALNKTQLAVHKFVKAEECADRHKIALDRVKMKVPGGESDVESDLRTLHLALTIDDWPLREEAVNLLEDIAQSAGAAEHAPADRRVAVVSDMDGRVARLTGLWDTLVAEVSSLLSDAESRRRTAVLDAVKAQQAILNELRDAVRASAEATDAEELSEHLDNLERLLERLSQCEARNASTLQDYREENTPEATSRRVTADIEQEAAIAWRDYCTQYDEIVPASRDRCERLRAAVTRCDEFEQALCRCQVWCQHVHHILGLRLHDDIYALDVPPEFKQAFECGTLFPQIEREFAGHEQLLAELNDFIESSKSLWSSNDRLRLQSEHAAAQLGELRARYEECKRPAQLNDRMDRISKRLSEIECAVDDLTGIEAENCDYCLTHCRQLARQLGADNIGAECTALEEAKDAFIRDALFSETQTLEIGKKISDLNARCAQLEQRALLTCDRLERCAKLVQKLDVENDAVAGALRAAEECITSLVGNTQQNAFADASERYTRTGILIRAAADGTKRARDFEALLRQASMRLAPTTVNTLATQEARLLALKRQMAVWAETVQTSAEDNQSALASFEKLADDVQAHLHTQLKDSEETPRSDTAYATLCDRLEAKGMQLIGRPHRPDGDDEAVRSRVTRRLTQINVLRQQLARLRADRAAREEDVISQRKASVSNPLPALRGLAPLPGGAGHDTRRRSDASANTANDASSISSSSSSSSGSTDLLAGATRDCLTEFENALAYLDFVTYPLESLEDWQQRLKTLSAWMASSRPRVEALLANGRRVAERGRMELQEHEALSELDRLVAITNRIDAEAVESQRKLRVAEAKLEALRADIRALVDAVAQLRIHNLDVAINSVEILSTQRDLMEACSRLRVLQHAAGELRALTPAVSGDAPPFAAESASLDALNAQLRSIEERVQEALVKALRAQEAHSATVAERASLSSGAGLSLAMDVHETEPEDAADSHDVVEPIALLKSGAETTTTNDKSDDLNQFFVELDTIEEFLDKPDNLPFEDLDAKRQEVARLDSLLTHGESVIDGQQMTMGLAEREHALQRIGAAHAALAARRVDLEERRVALTALENHLADTEALVVQLGAVQKRHTEPRGSSASETARNRSPDLDELEASQLEMEDLLPPIAVRLQQATNRLDVLASRLAAASAAAYAERLAQLRADFAHCSADVRERRRNLEERLADHTHLNNQLEMLEFWCDETEAGVVSSNVPVSVLSPVAQLAAMLREAEARHAELPERLGALRSIENLRDRIVASVNVELEMKHNIRRSVAQVAKRVSDLKFQLGAKLEELRSSHQASDAFWRDYQRIDAWIADAVAQLDAVRDAKIYRPSLVNVERMSAEVPKLAATLEEMQQAVARTSTDMETTGSLNKKTLKSREKFDALIRQFHTITSAIEKVLTENGDMLAMRRRSLAAGSEQSEDIKEYSDTTNGNAEPDTVRAIEQSAESAPPSNVTEYGTLSNGTTTPDNNNNNNNLSDKFTAGYSPPDASFDFYRAGSERASQRRPRKMSISEQARLDTVTRFTAWLEEVQRDSGVSVDLADQHIIRQAMGRAQNWIDELQVNRVEVLRVVDEASDRLVTERAVHCGQQMDKVLALCQQRRVSLQTVLEECRAWEQLRVSIEMWLEDAEERLTAGPPVNMLTDVGLVEQLALVGRLASDAAQTWCERLQRFNNKSNAMLDAHRHDDGHNLSHLNSRLNTQWSKFNDALRIHRAGLEAAQRSRHDFHSALGQLQQWLERQSIEICRLDAECDNAQLLKDTGRRREWLAQEKDTRAEVNAHRDVIESVRQMGEKLLVDQAAGEEREQLRDRLRNVEEQWHQLVEKQHAIRDRLESAQEECEALTQGLADYLYWTNQQLKTIANAQPVGGDLQAIQAQLDVVKTIERTMEARERRVQDCIQLAHSYLMQHDLRPAIHKPSALDASAVNAVGADDDAGAQPLTEAQREERRVGMQIHADSERLHTLWELLRSQCANWSDVVTRAYRDMHTLDATIAEALLALSGLEDDIQHLPEVETLLLEELKDARTENAALRKRAHDASTRLDDVNDCAGQIVAKNVALSAQLNAQIHAINQRFERLKQEIACRGAALERAFNDFGPSSEHFLMDSVTPPWQRAISAPHSLPYYIDHSTELTQWDHPLIVEVLEHLSTFNQVKFSAYRTAMKLRALQKRLCLDLIELSELDKSLKQRLTSVAHEDRMQMEDAVMCLAPLFKAAHDRYPNLVKNVPLAVDMTLNLLLNVYDACRDGRMRVLSFKIALVMMCNATLESKYKYLYGLVSTPNGVDQKALAILFYDLIHLPKFLGESAAFGGLNVEPSVRSCFEYAHFGLRVSVDEFLDWVRKEPQSLVWLPVMHRLASSEFAKHSAKCNACKMFPIVGLRYRCLRCFNFDICQNCFFSQRTAKNHKLTHPMQEYCLPTNPKDDVRDFTAMVRNKMRRKKTRIGYLPVDQAIEGAPLEQSEQTPQNATTESMHQRMHLFAQRLETKRAELEAERTSPAATPPLEATNGRTVAIAGTGKSVSMGVIPTRHTSANTADDEALRLNVKSPLQILSEAELMRKEELDQVLQKLQYENMRLRAEVEKRRREIGANHPAKSAPNLANEDPENTENGVKLRCKVSQISRPPTIIQQEPAAEDFYYANTATTPSAGVTHFDGGAAQPAMFSSGRAPPPLPPHGAALSANKIAQQQQEDEDDLNERKAFAETRCLRVHQQRLEQRSRILEEHNRQLQQHLDRLQSRLIYDKQKSLGALTKLDENVELDTTAMNGGVPLPPAMLSYTSLPHQYVRCGDSATRRVYTPGAGGAVSSSEDDDPLGRYGTEIRRQHMYKLMSTVDELNHALESFVGTVVMDGENPQAADEDQNDQNPDYDVEDAGAIASTTRNAHNITAN